MNDKELDMILDKARVVCALEEKKRAIESLMEKTFIAEENGWPITPNMVRVDLGRALFKDGKIGCFTTQDETVYLPRGIIEIIVEYLKKEITEKRAGIKALFTLAKAEPKGIQEGYVGDHTYDDYDDPYNEYDE